MFGINHIKMFNKLEKNINIYQEKYWSAETHCTCNATVVVSRARVRASARANGTEQPQCGATVSHNVPRSCADRETFPTLSSLTKKVGFLFVCLLAQDVSLKKQLFQLFLNICHPHPPPTLTPPSLQEHYNAEKPQVQPATPATDRRVGTTPEGAHK